jgi:hypothetical protein
MLYRTAVLAMVTAAGLVLVSASASASAAATPPRSAKPHSAEPHPAEPGTASSAGKWGKATAVPGLAGLNAGGNAWANQVSCSSAGNCGTGGFYTDAAGHEQAFVATERNGTWSKALEVPGSASLNTEGFAAVSSVSCAGPGDCSAGGYYRSSPDSRQQAFVVTESNGKWGNAAEVPGLVKLNAGDSAGVESVSCRANGDCSAGGYYVDSSGTTQAFVVNQRNGEWGTALPVPGLAKINSMAAVVNSVSCAAPGDCSAVGSYDLEAAAFAVNEVGGTWGEVQPIAAPAGGQGEDELTSVSCAGAGDCSAGGDYADSLDNPAAFVVSERSGKWGKATVVAGLPADTGTGNSTVDSVSCAAPGYCSAAGYAYHAFGSFASAILVTETKGTWAKAGPVAGVPRGTGASSELSSVSCATAGNCAAGGDYDTSRSAAAYLVNESSGKWGTARPVPGVSTASSSGAFVIWVSCTAAARCAAVGVYNASAGRRQVFVVSET